MVSTAVEKLACPVEGCEEEFSPNNRARHLRQAHGIEANSDEYRRLTGGRGRNEARDERRQSYTHGLEQRVQDLTKPLREELRGINRRLSEIDVEAVELRAARRRIEQVLKQLDPTSFVAKPKNNRGTVSPAHVGSPEMRETKEKAVLDFLNQNRDKYADGLTAAGVYRDMKEAGIEPISAPNRILEQVRQLHADGVLRADKKIRGGAMQYKFVSNGASDGA